MPSLINTTPRRLIDETIAVVSPVSMRLPSRHWAIASTLLKVSVQKIDCRILSYLRSALVVEPPDEDVERSRNSSVLSSSAANETSKDITKLPSAEAVDDEIRG